MAESDPMPARGARSDAAAARAGGSIMERWPPRRTLLFVVGASTALWAAVFLALRAAL